ncbi:hypothetical protein SDC9_147793 [bioreactor metagenome]|uniref:Uncharacterized protein n=1 Tax=bioreactor metagenome TaxID=1076179 RepID=A0A645EFS2_9ZZZZ
MLETTTFQPISSVRAAAKARALASVSPPGLAGTTSSMVRAGHSLLAMADTPASSIIRTRSAEISFFIREVLLSFLGFFYPYTRYDAKRVPKPDIHKMFFFLCSPSASDPSRMGRNCPNGSCGFNVEPDERFKVKHVKRLKRLAGLLLTRGHAILKKREFLLLR